MLQHTVQCNKILRVWRISESLVNGKTPKQKIGNESRPKHCAERATLLYMLNNLSLDTFAVSEMTGL